MSLWYLLADPLISSTNLMKLTPAQLALLTNREAVAVDQDPEGIQGYKLSQDGPIEVWGKSLSGRCMAVGLFNSGESALPASVGFGKLGFSHPVHIRNLWEKRNLGVFQKSFKTMVPRHGVVMIEIH